MSDNINNIDKNKLLEYIFSLNRRNIKPGLERTQKLLSVLGNPQDSFQSIHIAGTNGKGSVASFIASILMEKKLNVGLYTSPHIFNFEERVRVNNSLITLDDIAKIYNKIHKTALEISATFFEITTAIAFAFFKERNIDIAVIETGMGGRFDSTNVITPLVSIITNVGIDHTDYLGDTIEKIAAEKAGIIKENIPVIVGSSDLLDSSFFVQKANEVHTDIYIIDNDISENNIKYSDKLKMNLDISINNKVYNINSGLIGRKQADNIKIAVKAAELIKDKFGLSDDIICSGIENVKTNTNIEFRIEAVMNNPFLILDVSHNPNAIKNMVSTLEEAANIKKWDIVFGAMADKDIKSMLEILLPYCNILTIVRPSTNRAETIDNIEKLAVQVGFKNIKRCEDISKEAVNIFNNKYPTVICGSFYVASDFGKCFNMLNNN